jgi:hypothetical protein
VNAECRILNWPEKGEWTILSFEWLILNWPEKDKGTRGRATRAEEQKNRLPGIEDD